MSSSDTSGEFPLKRLFIAFAVLFSVLFVVLGEASGWELKLRGTLSWPDISAETTSEIVSLTLTLAAIWWLLKMAYEVLSSPKSAEPKTTKSKPHLPQERSHQARQHSPNGYVYVLTNPEIPGKVKIGHTERSAKKRARELSSNTGVPGRYEVAHEIDVLRPERIEKRVHRRLSSERVSGGEFFRVSPKEAARVIKREAGK